MLALQRTADVIQERRAKERTLKSLHLVDLHLATATRLNSALRFVVQPLATPCRDAHRELVVVEMSGDGRGLCTPSVSRAVIAVGPLLLQRANTIYLPQ